MDHWGAIFICMNQPTNPWPIVGAILVAGAVIALAVFYSRPGSPAPSGGSLAGSAANPNVFNVSADDDTVLGDPNAPVTVIEFGDYQCPFCERFFRDVEPALREKYVKTGKVKFVYRDFAFLGDESRWAASASECADEQGKFWAYHDLLFERQRGENQGTFVKENLKRFASELGLERSQFDGCLDSEKYAQEIDKDLDDAKATGVSGTPTTFINGQLVRGALPLSEFERIIEAELAKAIQ